MNIVGDIVSIGVCVFGCGAAALIGFAIGNAAGAGAAVYAFLKAMTPVWIGGAAVTVGGLVI